MRHLNTVQEREGITKRFAKFVHDFLKKSRVDGQAIRFGAMKDEIEPMQQPVRKIVGRTLTTAKRLAHLEDLTIFLKKHCHGALARTEGDFFPVRKIVGRPRKERA